MCCILITYIKTECMEKINLCVARSLSEIITATFQVLKQEIKPFLRAFAVLALPVIVLFVLLLKDMLMEFLFVAENPGMMDTQATMMMMQRSMLTGLFGALMGMWVQLFTLAYLRVYHEHYTAGVAEAITVKEVFDVMRRKFLVFVGWSVLYGLIVGVGLMLCVIPGVWLGISLLFGGYYVMMRDMSVGDALSASWQLVKGAWWLSFGCVVVLSLITSIVGYVFGIPYLVVTMGSAFGAGEPNVYLAVFTLLISYFGQYLLMTVMFAGVTILYFSLIEDREHLLMFHRIEEMGGGSTGNGAVD